MGTPTEGPKLSRMEMVHTFTVILKEDVDAIGVLEKTSPPVVRGWVRLRTLVLADKLHLVISLEMTIEMSGLPSMDSGGTRLKEMETVFTVLLVGSWGRARVTSGNTLLNMSVTVTLGALESVVSSIMR